MRSIKSSTRLLQFVEDEQRGQMKTKWKNTATHKIVDDNAYFEVYLLFWPQFNPKILNNNWETYPGSTKLVLSIPGVACMHRFNQILTGFLAIALSHNSVMSLVAPFEVTWQIFYEIEIWELRGLYYSVGIMFFNNPRPSCWCACLTGSSHPAQFCPNANSAAHSPECWHKGLHSSFHQSCRHIPHHIIKEPFI